MDYTYSEIAKMIDHALLNPALTREQLEQGCRVAREYDVASVCVPPHALKRCAKALAGSAVKPTTTIGFPHGGQATAVKVAETLQAIEDGAQEMDMVVNISRVLSGDWGLVRADIGAVVLAAHEADRKVKVIFENCYLPDEAKIRLCQICGEVEAEWVKTSTGFGPSGATFSDVALMRRHAPGYVQIKAAGGIRDLETLLEYRRLGASRIGTSSTRQILEECRRHLPVGIAAS
jgi:deoxyribose-phosphate aldolase